MKKLHFVIAIIFSIACSSNKESVKNDSKAETTITYLALGDSYTIGEMVTENDRWPAQLVSELYNSDIRVEKPTIIAKTGWRSDELINNINKASLVRKFDLISIQIGVNNQYQYKKQKDFILDFQQILENASKLGKSGLKSVFVVSIPDYSLTPFGKTLPNKEISTEIKTYNAQIMKICNEMNVVFIDISKAANQVKNNTELVANDKLHPSAKQYKMWTNIIFPSVITILKTNSLEN